MSDAGQLTRDMIFSRISIGMPWLIRAARTVVRLCMRSSKFRTSRREAGAEAEVVEGGEAVAGTEAEAEAVEGGEAVAGAEAGTRIATLFGSGWP